LLLGTASQVSSARKSKASNRWTFCLKYSEYFRALGIQALSIRNGGTEGRINGPVGVGALEEIPAACGKNLRIGNGADEPPQLSLNFVEYMQIAGGLVVLVVYVTVLMFLRVSREYLASRLNLYAGKIGSPLILTLFVPAMILMAVGSLRGLY
jgi:hypothetical protein